MKTKEEFLTCDLTKVSKIYVGRDRICRCGCAGDYIYTSYSNKLYEYSVIDDKKAKRRLNRAIKLVKDGAHFDIQGGYINIVSGNDRAITVYFNE